MTIEKICRKYRMKVYLNARHFIYMNGTKGVTHPHTWEFAVDILVPSTTFVEFSTFESKLNEFLEQYQNQVINDLQPFDTVIPTLENIADYFAQQFNNVVKELDGSITQITASETPTRSYIIDITDDQVLCNSFRQYKKQCEKEIANQIIDIALSNLCETKNA